MNSILLSAGIASIVAAIIGGGLKAFNIEIPYLANVARQVLLFVAGAAFVAGALLIDTGKEHPGAGSHDGSATAATSTTTATSPPDPSPPTSAHSEGAGTKSTVATRANSLVLNVSTSTTAPARAASAAAPAPLTADAVAGHWAGRATHNGVAFDVRLEVRTGCAAGEECGTIFVSNNNCTGTIALERQLPDGRLEFNVVRFSADSGPNCQRGDGEYLLRRPDGSLAYTTNYGPAGSLTMVA